MKKLDKQLFEIKRDLTKDEERVTKKGDVIKEVSIQMRSVQTYTNNADGNITDEDTLELQRYLLHYTYQTFLILGALLAVM